MYKRNINIYVIYIININIKLLLSEYECISQKYTRRHIPCFQELDIQLESYKTNNSKSYSHCHKIVGFQMLFFLEEILLNFFIYHRISLLETNTNILGVVLIYCCNIYIIQNLSILTLSSGIRYIHNGAQPSVLLIFRICS